jgi:opacity protein-like surface antigen
MKSFCAILGLLMVFSVSTLAQEKAPIFEGFGGYSYVRVNATDLKANTNGWDGQAALNVTHWLGIVADVSGVYGSPTVQGTQVNIRIYSYMFGPRFSYRKNARVTPFGHALFGQGRLYVTVPGLPPQNNPPVNTAFAMAVGGGVDVKLAEHIAFRVGQFEWLRTGFSSQTQNNLRFSTGIVFRLGEK